jgi:hypothetical protein
LSAVFLILQPEIRTLGVLKPHTPSGRSVAVIGDSDSHIYRDKVWGIRRGGEYHDITFQWTEIWDRLRGSEVDQGELGVWGTRGKIARVRGFLGLEARYIKKMDYRYNYALSGARCESVNRAWPYQARSLMSLMNKNPEWFQSGLVFVRIGINDFGQQSHLREWAKTGLEGPASDIVNRCLADIRQVVEDVLNLPTDSMVVLVDVSRDYNISSFNAEELTPTEIDRMLSVLDRFQSGLEEMARSSDRVAYVNGEAPHWGDRILGTQRQEIMLGGSKPVKNTVGDEPFHRTLLDGHASTINNGLWLQSAIQEINKQLGTGFTPILDAEIADLVDSDGRFGIAPEKRRYPQENIQFANMPDRLHIWRRDLPYDLPQLVATSAEGLDVTDSISAFLEGGAGTGFWLHGSGREISLRSTQLEPGDYKLRLSAQDRYGNRNKWYSIVVVYD